MLKAEVTTDEKGKCTCEVQAKGNATDLLVDLSTVIYDVYNSLKGWEQAKFRIAFTHAALDPDGPFWNLDQLAPKKEADHGE